MKCTTVIDKNREEEVIIYLREPRDISKKIEKLVAESVSEFIGYGDSSIVPLSRDMLFSVSVEDGKVIATTASERLQLRERLYVVEERLGDGFVKINQSCIVNLRQIERFDVSIGGSLLVILKNGYKDYVSRRQLKTVKERMGFKL